METPDSSFAPPKFQINYSYKEPRRNPTRLVVVFLVFLVVGGLIFGGAKFLGGNEKSPITPTLIPTPTEEIFPTDTPSPTASVAAAVTSKPTPSPKPTLTSTVDKATGLDRSALSVSVQNGSGEVGAASKASDVLKGFGYKVVSTGNADSFNYENTVIEVKSEKSSYLALLKKDLSSTYTIGSTSAVLSASESADAVVIVGKE